MIARVPPIAHVSSKDMGNQFCRTAELFGPPSVFQFQKFEGLKFFVIYCSSMGSNWFTSTFLNFSNFLKLKRGHLISWWEPLLQIGWIIWLPLLYFNIRNLKQPNFLSFITFQLVLHDSSVLFSIFWNFLKLKRGGPDFLVQTNSADWLNYSVPPSVFQF